MRAIAAILTLAICCGCTSVFERPAAITPADIYAHEDAHYPASSWSYLGSKGPYHYFETMGFEMAPKRLHRKYLPELQGYPYRKDHPIRESADVEIWADCIRIEIDGEKPLSIPFQSKGFITAGRRPVRKPHQSLPKPQTTGRVIHVNRSMEKNETLRVDGPSTFVIE